MTADDAPRRDPVADGPAPAGATGLLRILLAADATSGEPGPLPAAERLGRRLRDDGHEVVFVGELPSREVLAAVAIQEDVDATLVCSLEGTALVADDPQVRAALRPYAEVTRQ